jgi:hypothetical protein
MALSDRRYKYRLLGIQSGCELSNNSKRGAFKANNSIERITNFCSCLFSYDDAVCFAAECAFVFCYNSVLESKA